jgi:uncharacterized membrane protein SpoIIM required for sporulation
MREVTFIKQNAEKWQEFEEDAQTNDPDVLSERFVQLTDDLSFARTFYEGYPVAKYLNNLTASFHQKIYQNKKQKEGRFAAFWLVELPTLFRQSHRQLLYSFLIMLVGCIVGAVSAKYDETFVRLILGDSYVNMTLQNIEKGDPMAVYKSSKELDMFFAITINNIKVSFVAFVMGILFSVGTFLTLFYNGVMLGSFQYFFYKKGLLLTSVLSIWIHGTLEISAIIIAGCAGLVMGNSIVFPKTYSRLDSLKQGAKQGVKIIIGLVPVFIMAGFLESFVTRLSMPPLLSGSIILISASFIVWYFVIYPIRLSRQSNNRSIA